MPLQALYLMNSPFVHEQATAFAERLVEFGGDSAERLARAYELAWGRLPEPRERKRAAEFLKACHDALAASSLPALAAERETWASLAKVLLTANEFLYVD